MPFFNKPRTNGARYVRNADNVVAVKQSIPDNRNLSVRRFY